MSGTVEDLLEDGFDGDVTSVGGEDDGMTRRREFKIGSVGEGPFCIVEGRGLRRALVEGLGLPSKGGVQRSHGGGDVRQESMVVVDHADKLLQAFTVVGVGKAQTAAIFSCRGRTPLEEI